MFAYAFANDDHHVITAVNFPNHTTRNYQRRAQLQLVKLSIRQEDGKFKQTPINTKLFVSPANPVDYQNYYILNRPISNAYREQDLGQDVNHLKPKQ